MSTWKIQAVRIVVSFYDILRSRIGMLCYLGIDEDSGI